MSTSKQHSLPEIYIGVDGGGTKTLAWIGCQIRGQLQVLGAGQGGPSNPRAVGFDQSFASITRAIEAAFESAGLVRQQCSLAVFCLAGAGRDQEKLKVEAWAVQSGLALHAKLVSEAEAILAAVELNENRQDCELATLSQSDFGTPPSAVEIHSAMPTGEIALVCGTGSLAWGRLKSSNTSARSGGWGYLLGDEGSGFWIGQRLLQIACHTADHRSDEDAVLVEVLQHLRLSHPSELIDWCYGSSAGRQRIASLAPIAFQLKNVDSVAHLIHSGAHELAKMIATVAQQLGCASYALAASGSVVLHQQDYLELIVGLLRDQSLAPVRYTCVAEPVRGALRIACCGS